MIPLLPFPGWLVHPDWAERVVAPFLDQVAADDRARILSSNPDSYLHVSRPAEDGEDPEDAMSANRAALARLLDAGAFRRSEGPLLYLYRLRSNGFEQTGVVAEIPVEAFANGQVLGHEAVQPERVESMAQHMRVVGARSELVALMSTPAGALERMRMATTDRSPALEITAGGVGQTVWPIDDPVEIANVSRSHGSGPLYIADGHHRVAAAVGLWEDAGRPEDHRVLCVVYPQHELRMLAFDRRVAGPLEADATLARIGGVAEVEPAGGPVRQPAAFGLYLAGHWYRLAPHDRAPIPGVEGLDVTILHRDLLEPILGLAAEDPRLEFVPELVPLEELVRRCDGDAGAIFVLHPPSLAQLIEVADLGEVMPPKATYFHPKPLTGLILRFTNEA
jgi:uncharacterized protein (DUF1015 family)